MLNISTHDNITTENNIGYISANIDNVIIIKNIAVANSIALNVEKPKYLMKCANVAIMNILTNSIIITCSFRSIFIEYYILNNIY